MLARASFLATCFTFFVTTSAFADGAPRVAWNARWPRVQPWEYALTAGLAVNVAAAVLLYKPTQANWKGGILFDDGVRDAIVLRNPDAREQAASISDDIYYALAVYPLIVDTAAMTWGVHGAPDVAFQMTMINFESYALTGAVALAAEKIGRVRPMARQCARDPNYDWKCKSPVDLNLSFLSGHTTIAFAGAGLMCAHHTNLPIYGGGVADALACASALSAATAAGVLRVMSDNHYASDVILGAGIGLFGGYVWPMIWHYSWGRSPNDADGFLPRLRVRHGGTTWIGAAVPQISAQMLGLALIVDIAGTERGAR